VSEEAARRLAAERGLSHEACQPRRTLLELVEAVAAREAELAVLPAENLWEGSVTQNWDALLANPGVQLPGETVLPVHHHLLG
jgi:prephenate dehydratase